ncbi:hypothetical protein PSV09DRAFT_2374418 [Bipolaris maydis]|nr:hypothetical protein J3E74DRAFT_426259 [Bipolaris maydis]KAJ6208630.1 hypothetical protein PSV09DRAFT_2374418 [Bipolaris maydis]
MPGIAYYSCAKAILKYKLGERNIPVAQALTLAALYMNQNGMLHDSLTYLCNARDIYIDVVKTNTSLSDEAKRSFWIYWELTCGIDNYSNWASDPLRNHLNTLVPEKNVERSPERVYWNKIALRILLDGLRDSARLHLSTKIEMDEKDLCDSVRPHLPTAPRYVPTTREMDEKDLCGFVHLANEHIGMLEVWRSNLVPQLTWKDTEPPSTDPIKASLQAEYYEGAAALLRPYLDIAVHAMRYNADSVSKELSEGQQGILKVLFDWEKHALSSMVCFDRVGTASDSKYEMYQSTGGSSVILSNPVNTLHAKFKNVFLLRALRFSAIHPWIAEQTRLTDEKVDKLHRYTIKSLSSFRAGHRTLTRDLEALNRLQSLGDSVPWMDLVSAYE